MSAAMRPRAVERALGGVAQPADAQRQPGRVAEQARRGEQAREQRRVHEARERAVREREDRIARLLEHDAPSSSSPARIGAVAATMALRLLGRYARSRRRGLAARCRPASVASAGCRGSLGRRVVAAEQQAIERREQAARRSRDASLRASSVSSVPIGRELEARLVEHSQALAGLAIGREARAQVVRRVDEESRTGGRRLRRRRQCAGGAGVARIVGVDDAEAEARADEREWDAHLELIARVAPPASSRAGDSPACRVATSTGVSAPGAAVAKT